VNKPLIVVSERWGAGMLDTVSFVIIAHNEQDNIADCICSVLAQDHLPTRHEVIVVDDGSTDATADQVRAVIGGTASAVKLVSQRNMGRGAARAAGVNLASGRVIAMVDGDVLLPANWLETCHAALDRFDAVSGTPVPDGDVAYVFRRFGLEPKVVGSSTTIKGSNALYRASVFSVLQFDARLTEGEDTDFSRRLSESGLRTTTIDGLVVRHRESKSFGASMMDSFGYGVGATRHLKRSRRLRLPDLVFGAMGLALGVCTALAVTKRSAVFLAVPPALVGAAAAAHMHRKFYLHPTPRALIAFTGGCCTDAAVLSAYLAGRTAGLIRWRRLD
jgi:glycosyltransferase involved in cell wall biosynthesis